MIRRHHRPWSGILALLPCAAAAAAGCDRWDYEFSEREWVSVSVGAVETCAVATDGSAECWTNARWSNCQARQPGGLYTEVSVGQGHTCGLATDGSIACWGCDGVGSDKGQCVAPGGVFVQVAAGNDHSCGLREDGTVACWGCGPSLWDFGDSDHGQCTPPDEEFDQIAVGSALSCGVRVDGAIHCWGTTEDAGQPRVVWPASGGFQQVSVGPGDLTCALDAAGAVVCWNGGIAAMQGEYSAISVGSASLGGLDGDGRVWIRDEADDEVWELYGGRAVALDAGDARLCVIVDDATVWCNAAMTGELEREL